MIYAKFKEKPTASMKRWVWHNGAWHDWDICYKALGFDGGNFHDKSNQTKGNYTLEDWAARRSFPFKP